MGIRAGSDLEDRAVPGWLDVVIAVWIVICTAAFISKILLDVGMAPPMFQYIIFGGKYLYAILVAGCLIGSSLALLRRLRRS